MAEPTQLSDSKVSDALGLKMGLDPTGSMAAPKASAESKSIIPQIDYTGLAKQAKTPEKALELKGGLLSQQQKIEEKIPQLEQQKVEQEAEFKLLSAQQNRLNVEQEYKKLDKFYKEYPRPEFYPTKDNMQDIATLFSLVGVIGMALGGSGKMAAMNSLTSMTGMMKGWREGRSDLWKKELAEFDKNMAVWKAKLDEAVAAFNRGLQLQATNRQEADALISVEIAKLGSPIVAEKVKKQGIQSGLTFLTELQSAAEKEIKQKFEEKKFNAEQIHRNRMEGFRKRELDLREREKTVGTLKPGSEVVKNYVGEAQLGADLKSLSDKLKDPELRKQVEKYRFESFLSEEGGKIGNQLLQQEIPSKLRQFISQAQSVRNNVYLNMSGKAVTGGEAMRNYGTVPQPGDTPEVIEDKIAVLIDQINGRQAMTRRTFGALPDFSTLPPSTRPFDVNTLQLETDTAIPSQSSIPEIPTGVPNSASYSPSQRAWWWKDSEGKWQSQKD